MTAGTQKPVQEEGTTWFGLGRTCRLCGNFDLQPRSPQRGRRIQHLSGERCSLEGRVSWPREYHHPDGGDRGEGHEINPTSVMLLMKLSCLGSRKPAEDSNQSLGLKAYPRTLVLRKAMALCTVLPQERQKKNVSERRFPTGLRPTPACHHAGPAPAARARHLLLMLRSMGFRLAA